MRVITKGRIKLREKKSEYVSRKPSLAGSRSFVGQLPDVEEEFDKGNPGFYICLCFLLIKPKGLFLKQILFLSFFFHTLMGVIMKILLAISSVKVPWQNWL